VREIFEEGFARRSRADAPWIAGKRVTAEGTDLVHEEMPYHDHSTPFSAMALQHDRQIGFFSRPCRIYTTISVLLHVRFHGLQHVRFP